MKRAGAAGTTAKHAGTAKHGGSSKHAPAKTRKPPSAQRAKVTAVAKPATHPKPRGLPLGDVLACCSAEALAMSARLAGAHVGADDVEALYWLTGGHPDAGASILATMEAAQEFALAGFSPAFRSLDQPAIRAERLDHVNGLPGPAGGVVLAHVPDAATLAPTVQVEPVLLTGDAGDGFEVHSLILGLELPGPHAVLAVGEVWWSWGRPWHRTSFPHAQVEEAWAVSWS